jgi:hypothetical protein
VTGQAAAWAEAWLPGFLLVAGLTLGAMITLALGRLLREAWLETLLPSLNVMARAAPALPPLGVPLLLAGPELYPWMAAPRSGWFDPLFVALRAVVALALWIVLGRLLAAGQGGRRLAGGALLLLVLTGAMAMQDWGLSRDVDGAGSLQALAMIVEQAGAAMALATIIALRGGGMPGEEARTGLERALLSVAMASLWLRFVQYIVAYAADLPPEAAWYLRRSHGVWWWLEAGVALPALLAAIALGIVPQWPRWRLAAVSLLFLAQHVTHLAWVVGPDAALSGRPLPMAAAFLAPGLMALLLLLAWAAMPRPACPRA